MKDFFKSRRSQNTKGKQTMTIPKIASKLKHMMSTLWRRPKSPKPSTSKISMNTGENGGPFVATDISQSHQLLTVLFEQIVKDIGREFTDDDVDMIDYGWLEAFFPGIELRDARYDHIEEMGDLSFLSGIHQEEGTVEADVEIDESEAEERDGDRLTLVEEWGEVKREIQIVMSQSEELWDTDSEVIEREEVEVFAQVKTESRAM